MMFQYGLRHFKFYSVFYCILICLLCLGLKLKTVNLSTMKSVPFNIGYFNFNSDKKIWNILYPYLTNHRGSYQMKCAKDLKTSVLYQDSFRLMNGSYLSVDDILSANMTYEKYCRKYQRKNVTFATYLDKYRIKQLLPKIAPGLQFAEMFAYVDDCDDISQELLEKLPGNYMMKAAHMSGGIIRVKGDQVSCLKKPFVDRKFDESKIDYMVRICQKLMDKKYWRKGELMYKYIPKRIIFEEDFQYLGPIQEYRFWAFSQKVAFLHINSNRNVAAYDFNKNIRTLDWEEIMGMNIKEKAGYECLERLQLPDQPPYFFSELLSHAKQISKLFIMARLDFYVFNNTYRFSEVTACSENCHLSFEPLILEHLFGYMFMNPALDVDIQYIMQKFIK